MELNLQINWTVLVDEAVRRRQKMKASQQQLAKLAKVSTPTIQRFERAEKDLRLSSVLAILGTLGMLDKHDLTFSDPAYTRDSRVGITFWGEDESTRVRCQISLKALGHFSEGGRLVPEGAFRKHRLEIEVLARRKYLLGRQHASGNTVLITEHDID